MCDGMKAPTPAPPHATATCPECEGHGAVNYFHADRPSRCRRCGGTCTASTLIDALRRRHAISTSAEAYAVMSEVRDVTGASHGGRRRYADILAIGLWPSRGLEIEGFEVKDHRSDWLREVKDPAKADAIFRFCDRWWLVSAPGVAKIEEVPSPWGWMEWVPAQKGALGRLMTRKQSPKMEPVEPSRGFLASLLRSLARAESFEHALAEARVQARAEGSREMKLAWDAWTAKRDADGAGKPSDAQMQRMKERLERLDQFEKESGVRIGYDYHAGQRVKVAMELSAVIGNGNGSREMRRVLVESAKKIANAAAAIAKVRVVPSAEDEQGRAP